tara:strand:- start:2698 stop:4593 length:1896 start_codon:yes stop_codon:yes gene_type:complete
MRQGIDTLEVEPMAAPQDQGLALLAAMEDPAMAPEMGDPSMGPDGGIQSLGAMEEEAMVPEGGIQGLSGAAEMLAQAGREGDIYIVHASEGDTVVPQEVLEGPGGAQIREMLFRQMAEIGVDPERYVVGHELNSLNPETGLPEFFFKKAFGSIKSFFKKAAPIVLPMVMSMTPLGPILGAAAGSGIASYLGGGSAKDALKAAAIGGVTAGFLSGVSGAMGAQAQGLTTSQGFMEGVKSGLPEGFAGSAFSIDGSESSLNPGTGPGGGPGEKTIPEAIYDKYFPDNATGSLAGDGIKTLDVTTPPLTLSSQLDRAGKISTAGPWGPLATDPTGRFIPQDISAYGEAGKSVYPVSDPSLYTGTGDYAPGVQTATAPVAQTATAPVARTTTAPVAQPQLNDVQKKLQQMQTSRAQNVILRDNALKVQNEGSFLPEATRDYLPAGWGGHSRDVLKYQRNINALTEGMENLALTRDLTSSTAALNAGLSRPLNASNEYSQYAIPLGAAGLLAYAGGAFDDPEQDPPPNSFETNPIDPKLVRQYRLFQNDKITRPVANPPIQFSPISRAHGGEMQNFPPRIGAISGPGTGKSDDVPAMLSDGEFVMTAQAVRGAGGGNRKLGVQNLYELMRNFEATV